eukprot:6280114-Prymnesium_polylepis.1
MYRASCVTCEVRVSRASVRVRSWASDGARRALGRGLGAEGGGCEGEGWIRDVPRATRTSPHASARLRAPPRASARLRARCARLARVHLPSREEDVCRDVHVGDELAPPLPDAEEGVGRVHAHVRLLLEHVQHPLVHQPVDLVRHMAHARQRLAFEVGAIVAPHQPRAHERKGHVVEIALQVALRHAQPRRARR